MADMNSESRNSTTFKFWQTSITENLSHMTMEVYGQDVTSTAAYSRQQAYDSNLQEIRKKREMRRQTKKHLSRLASQKYTQALLYISCCRVARF